MKKCALLLALLWVGGVAAAGEPQQYKTRLKASDPATWKPVPDRIREPAGGVTLSEGGLFRPFMLRNIDYLLKSFSVHDLLHPFRERAGQKVPRWDRPPVPFWSVDLLGSNAGRFLMGAGNTLRWMEHPELRKRMNDVVDGIEACREPNGYIYAFPPKGFLHNEQANYARAWFTRGMLAAAKAGNPKALGLMRAGHDWFNHCEYLPKLIYLSLGLQGHVASTRMYFSPAGKPEDLQVAEKYYVQDWWMDQFIARDPKAIWKYPLNRPHCYEITGFGAYLDHYRATGDRKYLDAMTAAWDMLAEKWEHVGGSWALCEGGAYPPCSYFLTHKGRTGELCCSVFWITFNQRFHRLYPDQEKYTAEIEKSIYNVGLANQDPANGSIRYHARMEGRKDGGTMNNTCCEGQGTRLYGSLPEYIYSIADDGLYVDLFEPSTIEWKLGGRPLKLTMETKFPFQPGVTLRVSTPQPVAMKLRVRVPGWATAEMPICVGGRHVAVGKPGTYQTIDRTWSDGDTVSFTLPMGFRWTCYTGRDQIAGRKRYALEYGPILMAVTGPLDKSNSVEITQCPCGVKSWLTPRPDLPLHFRIAGDARHEYVPYWQITTETFAVYPVVEPVTIKGPDRFLKSASVEILSSAPKAQIHYTIDGTEPTVRSTKYVGPFELRQTATVRARLFVDGAPTSDVVARTLANVPMFPPTIRPTRDGKSIEMAAPQAFSGMSIRYTSDGRQYEKGMGVHAVSELVYPLKPEYRRFVALAGIDDDTQGRGSVTFEVYVDDKLAYETPVLRAKDQWHIDVPIPEGSKTVRLMLTVGPDDYNYDWGDWLNAGFLSDRPGGVRKAL